MITAAEKNQTQIFPLGIYVVCQRKYKCNFQKCEFHLKIGGKLLLHENKHEYIMK